MRSLSTKVLVILLGMFIVSGVANYFILQHAIFPKFFELEQQEARRGLNRVFAAVERELFHLNTLNSDWANWDDTYQFTEDVNASYIESNLTDYTFTGNNLHLLAIIDKVGKVLWWKAQTKDGEPFDFPSLASGELPLSHPLLAEIAQSENPTRQTISGIFRVGEPLLLTSSHPILTSENRGPMAGYIIMGRLIDDYMIEELSNNLQLSFSIYDSQPSPCDGFSVTAALNGQTKLSNQSITCESNQPDKLTLFSTLPDLNGDNALIIELNHPKKITVKGQHAIFIALFAFLGSWLFITLVLMWLLQETITLPVQNLTRRMLNIRNTGDLSARIESKRNDEIGMLASEFNRMVTILERHAGEQKKVNERLQEIDQMRNEFISAAAHELNTPLTTIMGYTEFLHYPERFAKFTQEQQREFISEIYSGCQSLEMVISDILDISRFESGQGIPLELGKVCLSEVVEKVVRRFQIQTISHNFTIQKSDVEPIMLDRQRIIQVFDNLLSNAVKYSPTGGTVHMTVEQNPEVTRVAIADQGIGMTSEQMERIFDKFYRVDASNTAIDGLGLGMSIAKQIVESHGGEIRVESELGEGTTISFSLPTSDVCEI